MPDPADLENHLLRKALHENLVSFPSQIPAFAKQSRPELQQKVVILYFVRGWSLDDIAQRYSLGQQRIGQILTAWRICAVKENYVRAIDPEHPFFKKEPVEEPLQGGPAAARAVVKAPIRQMAPPACPLEVEKRPPATPDVRGVGCSALAEHLQAILGVLENQLRLSANHLYGSIASCEPLLDTAKKLCARVRAGSETVHRDDERRIAAIVSAAKSLFQRFEERALELGASAIER